MILPANFKDETRGRTTPHTEEEYRRYWRMSDREKQEFVKFCFAQREPKDLYATSRDYNLRELEIASIRANLTERGNILDLGCGNGYTLISIAEDLKDREIVGVDFSENLIKGANEILKMKEPKLGSCPKFLVGDALEYIKGCDGNSVKYIISERFMQVLPSIEAQKEVIRQAYRVLAPGGRLLMCEGFEDSFKALNNLRESMGLLPIPATSKDNVYALRLKDAEIEQFAQREIGFLLEKKIGYSLYFIISRVVHPLLVAPQRPRFDAKINELAMRMQKKLSYQPGFGSNMLWVLRK